MKLEIDERDFCAPFEGMLKKTTPEYLCPHIRTVKRRDIPANLEHTICSTCGRMVKVEIIDPDMQWHKTTNANERTDIDLTEQYKA